MSGARLAGGDAACREALASALDAGYAVLERGGTSLDAVTMAVTRLEDDTLFNAGTGAVLNRDGIVELDAAIMDGRTLLAGAVAGVRRVRNPLALARLVMDRSPHVMLIADGAERFAVEHGVALVANETLRTAARERELRDLLASGATARPVAGSGALGTVGAVACDARGDVAAATSTGGMVGKHAGRVGDSPVIGAGTYASNRSAAVSGTGHGESFIRVAFAHDLCARIEYLGMPLRRAVEDMIRARLPSLRARGGVIAVNSAGEVATDFNTECMFRAWRRENGERAVRITADR